jgi:hypothetical protein
VDQEHLRKLELPDHQIDECGRLSFAYSRNVNS